MKDKEKIRIFDQIMELLKSNEQMVPDGLKYVGILTKAQGIKGFHKCDIGHPVFENGDRYVLIMETLDGKHCVEVPYYKESLEPVIDKTKLNEKMDTENT